ncbi:MAG TPA: phosphoglycerate kinase [Candidatus Acidoferrales bacterium]|nr:phosphoglycerate kinase [Candidatus Acidoferrales bacterium]
MSKLSIRDLDLAEKRVFIRVDFNVPIKAGVVRSDIRIQQTLETLRYGIERGARLVLGSHLGRPKGKREPEQSLAPVAVLLAELLGRPVNFVTDCIGPGPEQASLGLGPGGVLLLENLRFHSGEEDNDPEFARQLARLADGLYVNDAFGTAHRAHASVVGITHFVRQAAAGLLMERELTFLGKALGDPERPFVAVLGGAKVSDKIEVMENMMKVADVLLVGGAMAYTFLKASGIETGRSLVEDDKLDLARRLLAEARTRGFRLLLPIDQVVAPSMQEPGAAKLSDIAATPDGWMGLDIGPETVAAFSQEIARARTVLWNGPMGVFEVEPFSRGTIGIAQAVAGVTGSGATSIVGGGDSMAALRKAGLADRVTHLSTGGGASLEFLAGRTLPGVAALTDRSGC